MVTIDFSLLYCCLGIWHWEDCNASFSSLALSLLGGCFSLWFLLPSLVLGESGSCCLVGNSSEILIDVATGSSMENVLYVLGPDT